MLVVSTACCYLGINKTHLYYIPLSDGLACSSNPSGIEQTTYRSEQGINWFEKTLGTEQQGDEALSDPD